MCKYRHLTFHNIETFNFKKIVVTITHNEHKFPANFYNRHRYVYNKDYNDSSFINF